MYKITSLSTIILIVNLGFSSLAAADAVLCEPDPGTDMLLEYGDSVACVFEESADVDVYRFVGSAGDQPFIQLSTTGSAAMILYDPQGVLLERTIRTDVTNISRVILENDGIHTIVVGASDRADNWEYTLELPCLSGKCAIVTPPDVLGYTAVEPCRIIDTRYAVGGTLSSGETRHFHTYGDVQDQNGAGRGAPPEYPAECPFVLGEHAAVHLNVTVVPRGPQEQGGYATLWPHGAPRPASSWLNYVAGVQNIANAGTVKTQSSDGATPDISVYSPRAVDLVIDVLGYYTE